MDLAFFLVSRSSWMFVGVGLVWTLRASIARSAPSDAFLTSPRVDEPTRGE